MNRKKTNEILARIRAARVIVWLERGWLHCRWPGPAVERLLPELDAHGEYIAAELHWRGSAPVMSGRLLLRARQ